VQSRIAVEQELGDGRLAEISVRGGLPKRKWYALRASSVPARPSVGEFLSFIKKR